MMLFKVRFEKTLSQHWTEQDEPVQVNSCEQYIAAPNREYALAFWTSEHRYDINHKFLEMLDIGSVQVITILAV